MRPGETDLSELLRKMRPALDDRVFVFCPVDDATAARLAGRAVGLFREREGVTLILDERDASGLPANGPWALITLTVHSDLAAVGFLAAVTAKLAAAGVSANAVSAYFHDHLFVPYADRNKALAVLTQ